MNVTISKIEHKQFKIEIFTNDFITNKFWFWYRIESDTFQHECDIPYESVGEALSRATQQVNNLLLVSLRRELVESQSRLAFLSHRMADMLCDISDKLAGNHVFSDREIHSMRKYAQEYKLLFEAAEKAKTKFFSFCDEIGEYPGLQR